MKTESNSRAQEITAALLPAYTNASKLRITKAEAKRLTKPFPDNLVEIRADDGAVWIPHIYISQRLNQVFGPGSWSLICREHHYDENSQHLYAEHVLLVRGCFVGEAVGEHLFNPLGSKKYGDSLEATAAEALRRICGKRLSCGNQVWEPTYCQRWQAKYAETYQAEIMDARNREMVKGILWRKKGAKSALDPVSETVLPTKIKRPHVDENLKFVMLQCLSTQGKENVLAYAIHEKILTAGQMLEDWPLEKVAVGEKEIRALQLKIQEHFAPKKSDAGDWRNFEIPFGSQKNKKLGDLKTEIVAAYWEEISPMKGAPGFQSHAAFREALNAAAKELHFQKLKK